MRTTPFELGRMTLLRFSPIVTPRKPGVLELGSRAPTGGRVPSRIPLSPIHKTVAVVPEHDHR